MFFCLIVYAKKLTSNQRLYNYRCMHICNIPINELDIMHGNVTTCIHTYSQLIVTQKTKPTELPITHAAIKL